MGYIKDGVYHHGNRDEHQADPAIAGLAVDGAIESQAKQYAHHFIQRWNADGTKNEDFYIYNNKEIEDGKREENH